MDVGVDVYVVFLLSCFCCGSGCGYRCGFFELFLFVFLRVFAWVRMWNKRGVDDFGSDVLFVCPNSSLRVLFLILYAHALTMEDDLRIDRRRYRHERFGQTRLGGNVQGDPVTNYLVKHGLKNVQEGPVMNYLVKHGLTETCGTGTP